MRAPLAAVLVLALAAPGCAEPGATTLQGAMPSLSQGRTTPQRYSPAPVPNPDITPPRGRRDPGAIEISPGLTRPLAGQGPAGDGFARGSAYSEELERRGRSVGVGSSLAPSLNFRLPVQVDVGQKGQ